MTNNVFIITREELYKEIWEISLTGVAKKYDLNYSKLVSACKEHNIPYPTSAYWTKKKMGLDIKDDVIPLHESQEKEIRLELRIVSHYLKRMTMKKKMIFKNLII